MTSTKRCGICGEALLSSDFSSDPSQHFCGLELNGAAIVRPGVVDTAESTDMSVGSSESADDEGDPRLSVVTAHAHNLVDLAEIGRLHMENEALKHNIQPATTMWSPRHILGTSAAVPAGQHVTQEVSMPGGESVMVEIAVHTK
ncbi:hypothetical protein LTR56_018281 [Elasticomyces elasticus]|nr:hypothetical protein LTR56_018281 [Elasticomyces elasticus]KAK3636771.1 hypothetical protein LTR22_018586 [Elasticomyces elasticus]KAK5751840.1 hypothetical protein LTS12_018081 [Elasticomyces elasticus]